jgi:DNA polymerase-1
VHELKKKPIDIIIASGDMDTLQLVEKKKVQVYTQRKGPNDIVLYDEDAVNTRYGFGPLRIPDYKGLRGDPSDNIPGIKGIGEKTATQLIVAFGTIEDIYKALKKDDEALLKANIKGKTAELIKAGEDEAVFSKMIATIRTDAPIKFEIPKKTWTDGLDAQKILRMFDELGFRSLMPRAKSLFGIKEKGEEVTGNLLATEPEKPKEAVDDRELRETTIALWLLNSDVSYPELDDVLRYGKTESFATAKAKIFADLTATGRLFEVFETIEKPLIPVVEAMCKRGIRLDTRYLADLSAEYHTVLEGISARIFGHVGHEFNISSPKQLGDVLFDELQLGGPKQKKTAGGQRSTKEEELLKLADSHPIIGEILSFRELSKLVGTYVDTLPTMVDSDSRLHTRFMQAGTTTGRMASLDPNLQNIPIKTEYGRRIREAFVADKGYRLLAIDYSQIELRIAAALSGDTKLISIFKSGGDVHAAIASQVFKVPADAVDREMRRRAKVINFGIIYGMGVNALRQNLGSDVSRDESAQFLADYFDNFQGLAAYLEKVKADAARLGYTETLFGRRRSFAGFRSPLPYVRAQAERMAINAPVQGTAADVIKKATVDADRMLSREGQQENVRLLLQVHDELVYEVKADLVDSMAQKLRHVMCAVVMPEQLGGVPLVVDAKTGKNWGDMEKI